MKKIYEQPNLTVNAITVADVLLDSNGGRNDGEDNYID